MDSACDIVNLPDRAPVMVLPEAMLFPHSILPLFLFEPRYREMLSDCLQSDRMFCVAMCKPGMEQAEDDDAFFHTAGIGLIRACVSNPDGTAHLILQGIERVRFLSFEAGHPYRVARIEPIRCEPGDVESIDTLMRQIVRLCEAMREKGVDLPPSIDHHLEGEPDPRLLADLVGSAFVQHPIHRQDLLQQAVLSERLRRLVLYLCKETA